VSTSNRTGGPNRSQKRYQGTLYSGLTPLVLQHELLDRVAKTAARQRFDHTGSARLSVDVGNLLATRPAARRSSRTLPMFRIWLNHPEKPPL